MLVKRFINHPVSSNCFVLYSQNQQNCIIIDPGTEKDTLLYSFLEDFSLVPQYIILTHHHFDHIWGITNLKKLYPQIQIVCNRQCSEMIIDKKKNCSLYFNQEGFVVPPADLLVTAKEEELLLCNNLLKFVYAPGHSSSGMLIEASGYLFAGDTLIKDEKTVLKLPTSSKEGLAATMGYISTLKGSHLIVCAGHGDSFNLDEYDLNKAL